MVSSERGPTQIVGQGIIMSDAESTIRRPPPTLGQHTDEILTALGYPQDAIAALAESDAI